MAGNKKAKRTFGMDEIGVRDLQVTASSRGVMTPSKNSFLPQLQEVDPRAGTQQKEKSSGGSGNNRGRVPSRGSLKEVEELTAIPKQAVAEPQDSAQQVMPVLESMEQDFLAHKGVLDIEQFTRAMLQHLEAQDMTEDGAWSPKASAATLESRGAAAIDLFRRVDFHSEGSVSWESFTNWLFEQGMAGGDDTVDAIKMYEASPVVDNTSHETAIDKLVYLEEVDSFVCLARNCQSFRVYDPKRCTVQKEGYGHRGTVVSCCYVGADQQIGTTSVDNTVCLWDAATLRLKSRMTASQAQLCIQYDANSKNIFTGSIDGTLSCWDLSELMLKDKKAGHHRKEINDLLMIPSLNTIATASADGFILNWDMELLKPKAAFKGHKKGVRSLAYSSDFECLLTCGADQDALVWNPYVEKEPIFRLKGHTRSLCGIAVLPGTPQIISADVAGTFRLWDMRNFRCVQSFGNETGREFNTFCTIPGHKRIVGGGTRLVMFDYMDAGGETDVTDTSTVVDALYNPNAGHFYTMANKTVKFWSASNGKLVKVLRDAATSEITAACISDNCQKLYLGDSHGRLAAHALHNGKMLTQFDSHDTDISALAVWKGTNWLISCDWDGTVKFHTDELSRAPMCHTKVQKHIAGITCLALCPELFLLATGGNDLQVVLYDLRSRRSEYVLDRFQYAIQAVDFVPSRCLLAVADMGGIVSLWRVRPHKDRWAHVYHFKATPDMGMQMPLSITALQFALPVAGQSTTPYLYTADAEGRLRCWDWSGLAEKKGVVEDDVEQLFEEHRIRQVTNVASMVRAPVASVTITRRSAQLPGGLVEAYGRDNPQEDLSAAADDGHDRRAGGAAAEVPGKGKDGKGAADAKGADTTALPAQSLESFITSTGLDETIEPSPPVQMVSENQGHSDRILSMYAINDPKEALLTCGLDRRVKMWSEKLEYRGALMKQLDSNFRFPYDASVAWRKRLDEANQLLKKIGPIEPPARKLPELPQSRRSTPDNNAPRKSKLNHSASEPGGLGKSPAARRQSRRGPGMGSKAGSQVELR